MLDSYLIIFNTFRRYKCNTNSDESAIGFATDSAFSFPGPEYYQSLTKLYGGGKGASLSAAFRRMLNVVAMGFNPMGSKGYGSENISE